MKHVLREQHRLQEDLEWVELLVEACLLLLPALHLLDLQALLPV
jgi:hypothetical protein